MTVAAAGPGRRAATAAWRAAPGHSPAVRHRGACRGHRRRAGLRAAVHPAGRRRRLQRLTALTLEVADMRVRPAGAGVRARRRCPCSKRTSEAGRRHNYGHPWTPGGSWPRRTPGTRSGPGPPGSGTNSISQRAVLAQRAGRRAAAGAAARLARLTEVETMERPPATRCGRCSSCCWRCARSRSTRSAWPAPSRACATPTPSASGWGSAPSSSRSRPLSPALEHAVLRVTQEAAGQRRQARRSAT